MSTGSPTPAISIVVPTYGRSRALACAIEGARRQTFTDWEMIVVGDECTDDTAEVVAGFDDPRISFYNLVRNFGEQAGPNNFGIAKSRAPLVAFLNHDDVWLPDHLQLCLEHLLTTNAAAVFGAAVGIGVGSPVPLQLATVQMAVIGLAPRGRYEPQNLEASDNVHASCVLARHAVLQQVGGFRPARELVTVVIDDLLFRIWRAGHRISALNLVTVVVTSAGIRTGSYLGNRAHEQEWVLEHLADRAFASELVSRAYEANPRAAPTVRISKRFHPAIRFAAAALAYAGINPRAVQYRLRRRLGPGDYIQRLRAVRGLPELPTDGTAVTVRAELARRACVVEPGETIAFRAGAGGARFLESGWSMPDDTGVWSDGPAAQLVFDLTKVPEAAVRLELTLEPFETADRSTRRVEITSGAQVLATWDLDSTRHHTRVLDVPRPARGSLARVAFRFPATESMYSRGLGDDQREVAFRLLSARIDVEP